MRGAGLGSLLALGMMCAGLLGIAGCGKTEDRDVFTQPGVVVYDERAVPHFVTMVHREYATPRCSLTAVASDGPRVVVAEAPIKLRECSEARAWSQLAGYALGPASW